MILKVFFRTIVMIVITTTPFCHGNEQNLRPHISVLSQYFIVQYSFIPLLRGLSSKVISFFKKKITSNILILKTNRVRHI